jgi:hypothetical protein
MRTTLTEALRTWRALEEPGLHPTVDALYAAASAGLAAADAALVRHLMRCGECMRELGELAESIRETVGCDLLLAKAAAAPLTAPVSIGTECGKYAIALYPRPDADEALIAVEVAPALRDALEGSTLTVSDRGGRTLVSAPVVLGRVSGRIHGLASIDLTRLVVRTGETTR